MNHCKALASYLTNLRIRSGKKSISEYCSSLKLDISETYYRALESGDKIPTVEAAETLAKQLPTADRHAFFQYYLQDILPPDVFAKLISQVVAEAPATSPKAAIAQREQLLAVYRQSLLNSPGTDLVDDAYIADEEMVAFLDTNFDLLPLVHFIYLRDDDISEAELQEVCSQNNIRHALPDVLEQFEKHRIAEVRVLPGNRRIIRRFNRTFRLPPSLNGRRLRARWLESETDKSIRAPRADPNRICQDGTFSFALINQYDHQKLFGQAQDRLADLIATLNAASVPTDAPGSTPYFLSVMVSPRPEYMSATTHSLRRTKVRNDQRSKAKQKGD